MAIYQWVKLFFEKHEMSAVKEEISTFFAFVGYFRQIYEVRSNDGVINRVVVSQLDLDPLAERREHLREYDLFVPRRAAGALADGSFTLK